MTGREDPAAKLTAPKWARAFFTKPFDDDNFLARRAAHCPEMSDLPQE